MYSNRLKNMEIPENLFSNLGESKFKNITIKEDEDAIDDLSFVKTNNKFVNYNDVSGYRTRITKMYDELNEIEPVDSKIDNVLYFDNYVEKGIVVKPKVSSLKQFWTEYRLINNEKNLGINKNDDDFNTLFDALSSRVAEINSYIDELKKMRLSITATTEQLEREKEELVAERQKFYDYKTKEESKLKEEKDNLKINFSRLQTIINDLDKKLENFDKE